MRHCSGPLTARRAKMLCSGLAWQMACLAAPLIGGVFAAPHESWPQTFTGTIFQTFPYALPCILVALPPALAVVVGVKYLKETHPDLRKDRHVRLAVKSAYDNVCKASPSLFTRLHQGMYPTNGSPNLLACGLSFALVLWICQLHNNSASSVAEILLYFSSPAIGGLGLKQQQMSVVLAIRPLLLCVYE